MHTELKKILTSDLILTGLALCLIIVNGLDVGTTIVALEHGAQELNPAVKTFVDNVPIMVGVKAIGIAVLLLMTKYTIDKYPQYPRLGYFALSLVVGIFLGAVINNFFALKSLGVL